MHELGADSSSRGLPSATEMAAFALDPTLLSRDPTLLSMGTQRHSVRPFEFGSIQWKRTIRPLS